MIPNRRYSRWLRPGGYILVLLILLFSGKHSFAQDSSRMAMDLRTDLILAGTGVTMLAVYLPLNSKLQPLSELELNALDMESVFEFDEVAFEISHSSSAGTASNVLLFGSFALPVALLAGKEGRQHAGVIALSYSEAMLLTWTSTGLLKISTKRYRPLAYDNSLTLDERSLVGSRLSFVSGHTSMTAAASFFTATTFAQLYPESKWKPVVWAGAAVIPAVTGYLRVKSGKHFPTDVLAGYALGASIGWAIPYLHRTTSNLKWNAGPGAMSLQWTIPNKTNSLSLNEQENR